MTEVNTGNEERKEALKILTSLGFAHEEKLSNLTAMIKVSHAILQL